MKILRRSLQVALIVYWVFALVMTHIPRPPPMGPLVNDKLIHFLAYGFLGGLMFITLWASRPSLAYLPLIVLAILLAYAAFDEMTQPIFGRDASVGDWLADSAGGLVAVVVLGMVWHFTRSRPAASA